MDVDGDGRNQQGAFDWATAFDELDIEEGSRDETSGRDSALYVIDMSKAMHMVGIGGKGHNDDGTPRTALKTTFQALRQAIVSHIFRSEQDLLGIVFYNTSKQHGTNFKNVYVFEDLQRPGADVIKKLEALIAMSSEDLRAEYGSVENCSIGDVLWACNSIFSNVPVKLSSKRILLFTANDNPHAGNQT